MMQVLEWSLGGVLNTQRRSYDFDGVSYRSETTVSDTQLPLTEGTSIDGKKGSSRRDKETRLDTMNYDVLGKSY